ncbi:MAG: YjbF family lipoprotein [Comamonas sp.]
MFLLVGTVAALTACTSASRSLYSAVSERWSHPEVDTASLPADRAFLRMDLGKATFILPRGAVERTAVTSATGESGTQETEVWYSGSGEVVRTTNGRITGTDGIRRADWRGVWLDGAPTWQQALQQTQPITYGRTRDLMPSHLYGLQERLTLTPIAERDTRVSGYAPGQLRWFREDTQTLARVPESSASLVRLPAALYAVDPATATVVYSEQCLSRDICLRLQRLGPQDPPSPNQIAHAGD